MSPGRFPLAKRSQQFRTEKLTDFIIYVLGHHPHEFGLVPDREGYVLYKELLQALHEEPEWRYVRRSHLNEMLMGKDRRLFEASEKGLRVVERRWQFDTGAKQVFAPGLLFTPVRRKAHPVAMEKGLRATGGRFLVLSQDREMARRIGTRKDQSPVILEIMAEKAQSQGIFFSAFGSLFLSRHIPPRFIAGPQVSKDVVAQLEASKPKKEEKKPSPEDFTPGSLILDMKMEPVARKKGRGKKPRGWKEEAKKFRRKRRKG
jgi:putative RNA 2'-phosphotransferase